MRDGIHIPRPSTSATSFEVRLAEKRSGDFLNASSKSGEETDMCGNCPTARYCRSVVTQLTDEMTPRQILDNEAFLKAHGIELRRECSVCPGKLAQLAIRQVEQGSFWIASDDPLNNSQTELQVGEALLNATQTIIERVKNGQAI